jgi:hypothetical protein
MPFPSSYELKLINNAIVSCIFAERFCRQPHEFCPFVQETIPIVALAAKEERQAKASKMRLAEQVPLGWLPMLCLDFRLSLPVEPHSVKKCEAITDFSRLSSRMVEWGWPILIKPYCSKEASIFVPQDLNALSRPG